MCRSKPALPILKRMRLVFAKPATKGRSSAERTSRHDGLLEEVREAVDSIRLRDFECQSRNGVDCYELRIAVSSRRRSEVEWCSLTISWGALTRQPLAALDKQRELGGPGSFGYISE